MNFGDLFKLALPRLLGGVFAGAATYIGVKTAGAVQIDPAQAAEVVTGVLWSYAASHRIASSYINPGDAAKARLADAEKNATDFGSTVQVQKAQLK